MSSRVVGTVDLQDLMEMEVLGKKLPEADFERLLQLPSSRHMIRGLVSTFEVMLGVEIKWEGGSDLNLRALAGSGRGFAIESVPEPASYPLVEMLLAFLTFSSFPEPHEEYPIVTFLLERHRVLSWWRRAYPGSYEVLLSLLPKLELRNGAINPVSALYRASLVPSGLADTRLTHDALEAVGEVELGQAAVVRDVVSRYVETTRYCRIPRQSPVRLVWPRDRHLEQYRLIASLLESNPSGLADEQLARVDGSGKTVADTPGSFRLEHDLPVEMTKLAAGRATLSPEDGMLAARLRAGIARVLGREAVRLDHYGTSVDVAAYLERRLGGTDVPVFRQSDRARGFRVLLLVDLSGSMEGVRDACLRAYGIVQRATKGLAVLDTWGFTQLTDGTVELFVGPRDGMAEFPPAAGYTPVYAALRAAREWGRENAVDTSLVVVLTDGVSGGVRTDRKCVRPELLEVRARDEIGRLVEGGVGVVALSPDNSHGFRRTFGSLGTVVSGDRLPSEMVSMVIERFVRHAGA